MPKIYEPRRAPKLKATKDPVALPALLDGQHSTTAVDVVKQKFLKDAVAQDFQPHDDRIAG